MRSLTKKENDMINLKYGTKVMIDHKMLIPHPSGKTGIGGPLVIYGIRRLAGIIDTISKDFVFVSVENTNYRVKVEKSKVMAYDPNNMVLVGTGNSMIDNGVLD